MSNLLIAFPEKTEAERKRIAKNFYHRFIDTFIETIKLITASKKSILRRCSCNWEVLNELRSTGRSIQVHLGHNFNWEWGNIAAAENIKMPFLVVYMPLSSPIFEKIFYRLRSKYGTILLRATHMREDFVAHRNTQYLMGLVADQNPGHPGSGWWFNFFGRPTPFVKGPAKAAILNHTAVAFAFIHRPKRGYYEGVVTVAEVNAAGCDEIELTSKFVRYLEDVIRQYPEMWLWSHRRWKHQWKEEYGPVHK